MKRANLQNRNTNQYILTLTLMLCFGLTLLASRPVAAQAAAEPAAPSEAEQRWVRAFLDYFEADQKSRELINVPKLTRVALRPFQLEALNCSLIDLMISSGCLFEEILNNTGKILVNQPTVLDRS
ncbi:MAG: hypothetical protein AAF085_15965, partial [Planctomycetota bacterium]